MSMQQMAQALGRVFGPMILSALPQAQFSIDPRYPYACAAVAAMIGSLVLMSLGRSFRSWVANVLLSCHFVVIHFHYACECTHVHPQDFTEEDVEDLGRFLCELLTSRHYRPVETKLCTVSCASLFQEILFPPLTNEDNFNAESREEGRSNHINHIIDLFRGLLAMWDVSSVLRRTPGAVGSRRRFAGTRTQSVPQARRKV
eukprot:Skav223607  [mRNA]  locus=scaffold1522:9008:12495:- [translate_table: standard]